MRIQRSSAVSTPITGTVLAMACDLSGFSCRPKIEDLECLHNSRAAHDKNFVRAFLKDAEEIFQTARQGGREDCELAILVGRDGGIHMLAGSGWELEPLRLHHGAKAAYRITRNGGGVRLEARSAGEACLLQAKPARPWRAALPDFPQYLTIP